MKATNAPTTGGLFKASAPGHAYLKAGIYGDPGSGKTYTASLIARGLATMLAKKGPKPPVLFFDTESGAAWMRPMFEAAGLAFLVHSSRAFADLKQAVVEAEQAKAILIVDSITHAWEEIREAYLAAKKKRTGNPHARLELPDWNVLKPAWGQFTAAYLNSRCHVILCGRGASVYEFQEREEDGKKELITVGTKMAAEKGLGYEPSLLVEMTARQVSGAGKRKSIVRTACVLKDRADVLDGLTFDDPSFESFLPHIERLNLGGDHVGFDASRRSEGLFPTEGAGRDTNAVRRLIVLDDAKDLLLKHVPGQDVASKQKKAALVRKYFGCGWVEAEELMPLDKLRAGYAGLRTELEPAPVTADGHPMPSQALQAVQDSVVATLEKSLAEARSVKAVNAVWGDAQGAFHQCDDKTQGKMLAVRGVALARVAGRNGKAAPQQPSV